MPVLVGGISWKGDARFQPPKILTGLWALKRNTAKSMFTAASKLDCTECVCSLMPHDWVDHYYRLAKDKGGLGHILVRRAEACLPPSLHANGKDELSPFLLPEFSATYDMTKAAFQNQVRLSWDEIYAAQEKKILLEIQSNFPRSLPGMYLLRDPEQRRRVYFGQGKSNVVSRSTKGHLNSPLRLLHVWATTTQANATALEASTHGIMEQLGITKIKGEETQGLYLLDHEEDLERVIAQLHIFDRFVFRNFGFFV